MTTAVRGYIGLAVVIVFILIGQPVSAQSSEWTEPERLSAEEEVAWFPEIDADASGTVRAISENTAEVDGVVRTEENGASFVLSEFQPEGWNTLGSIYVKDIYNAGRPIIVTDDQYIHLLGRALRGGGVTARSIHNLGGLYYMRAPLSADLSDVRVWSKPVPISTGAAYWASVAVLPGGGLIVVYSEGTDIVVNGKVEDRTTLFSRRSRDGGSTWDDPVRISYSGESVARSSVTVSDDGETIIVSWDEGHDNLSGKSGGGGLYTAVSNDGGQSWDHHTRIGAIEAQEDAKSELRISLSSHASRGWVEQGVVRTTGETTLLVYRAIRTNDLLYRVSSDGGQTWSDETAIPDAVAKPYGTRHHFDKLGLAVDGDGRFLLSYVGADSRSPTGISVMMTTFLDGEWTEPEVIATHDGYPEYPRIAVALGNQVHVTYFVRDNQHDEDSPMSVWAVRSETDARTLDPVPVNSSRSDTTTESGDRSSRENAPAPTIYPHPKPPTSQELPDSHSGWSIAPTNAINSPMTTAASLTVIVLVASALIVLVARSVRHFRI